MDKIKKIASKAFAALAIIGVFVAVCTADDQPNETTLRLCGMAALAVGLIGWSAFQNEEEARQ